jgi:hypothetical protein
MGKLCQQRRRILETPKYARTFADYLLACHFNEMNGAISLQRGNNFSVHTRERESSPAVAPLIANIMRLLSAHTSTKVPSPKLI